MMNDVKKRILNVANGDHFMALTTIVKRSNRKFSEIVSALAQQGERLSKSDLATSEGPLGQLIQVRGYSKKAGVSSMVIVDEILIELQKYGESFSADEWTQTKDSKGENALVFATRLRVLPKVFRPEIWINRTEEMLRLWQLVPENARSQISNFEERRAKAEQLSRPAFSIRPSINREELIEVDPALGFAPLQDHRTWKKWNEIVKGLSAKSKPELFAAASQSLVANAFTIAGEKGNILTKADLLKTGSGDRPYLKIAAEAGVLPQVIKYLEENGETLQREDFVAAGLGEMVKDADAKLYQAAEAGDDGQIRSLVATRIANIESRHGQKLLTPLMGATAKNNPDAMWALIEASADPDARSGKTPSLSTVWLASKHADAVGVTFVVDALKRKYENDPIKIMDCLLSIHDASTPIAVAKKDNKADVTKIFEDTIDEVSDIVVLMPSQLLTEHVAGRKSGLELISEAGKLPKLFSPRRWQGDPRGMHALAGQLPKDALDRQLTGKDGILTYGEVLAQVNASVLKRGLDGMDPR
jgi:hypothetical protein